jgi:formylglycine-generating enzyme required for sulfatase activity
MALRHMHVEQTPPPPSAFYPPIPPELDRLVLRALEKKPEQRYQTAAEFRQAILEFSGERAPTIVSEAVSTNAEPWRPSANAIPDAVIEPQLVPPTSTTAVAVTPSPVNPAITSPAVLMPAPSPAREAIAPTPRSSRVLYWLLAALVLAVLSATVIILNQRRAELPRRVASTPTPPPRASRAATPLEPVGMALIPGGAYLMGRNLSEAEQQMINHVFSPGRGRLTEEEKRIAIFSYDYPAHEVKVASFYLDQLEVSHRAYASFVRATGHASPPSWHGLEPPKGTEDLPVAEVSYHDAVEYCEWRTQQRSDGLSYRLPTEEEWEFAARGPVSGAPGTEQRLYPWGDQWQPGLANTKEARLARPQIVTAHPQGASLFRILNLSGNVAEWTATDFSHYPGSDRDTPREKGYTGTYQVVRGGSFGAPKEMAMTMTRAWARPTFKDPNVGFRCAADARR